MINYKPWLLFGPILVPISRSVGQCSDSESFPGSLLASSTSPITSPSPSQDSRSQTHTNYIANGRTNPALGHHCKSICTYSASVNPRVRPWDNGPVSFPHQHSCTIPFKRPTRLPHRPSWRSICSCARTCLRTTSATSLQHSTLGLPSSST